MDDLFSRGRTYIALAALVAIGGCGGSGLNPSSLRSTAGQHIGVGPLTKQFGVVLGNDAHADGIPKPWYFQWCNGMPGPDGQCYNETPGKHEYTDSASGTSNIESLGYTKAQIAGTSRIGTGSYTMYAETYEKTPTYNNVSASAHTPGDGWDDTLYISSGTLKKGTPVTIGVQWVLTAQTTTIACDSAQNSTGDINLYSAYITPPSGESQFEISGLCRNGTFVYYLYNDPTKSGKKAIGTINTSVGATYPIAFVVHGQTLACQPANKCSGDIFAVLDGRYKFSITSVTQGATVTSASGYTYP